MTLGNIVGQRAAVLPFHDDACAQVFGLFELNVFEDVRMVELLVARKVVIQYLFILWPIAVGTLHAQRNHFMVGLLQHLQFIDASGF